MDGRGAHTIIVGLVISYLGLAAFGALIYRTAIGGVMMGVGALVLLGLGLAVAWASARRRDRRTAPGETEDGQTS